MVDMDSQMKRLYEAANTLKGVAGQSKLARLLNASPQTVKNWEVRGISKQGMIEAQRAIGCSALWIETGEGAMTTGIGHPHQKPGEQNNTDPCDENVIAIMNMLLKLNRENKILVRGKIEAWIEMMLVPTKIPETDQKII